MTTIQATTRHFPVTYGLHAHETVGRSLSGERDVEYLKIHQLRPQAGRQHCARTTHAQSRRAHP